MRVRNAYDTALFARAVPLCGEESLYYLDICMKQPGHITKLILYHSLAPESSFLILVNGVSVDSRSFARSKFNLAEPRCLCNKLSLQ